MIRLSRSIPLLFIAASLANCAITFQVKKVDHELSRRQIGISHAVFFSDSRFRLAEEIEGDTLGLRLSGDATRIDVRRKTFEVRYKKKKTIRYKDGDWRLRFRALFWSDDYAGKGWRDYALGNLALLFPTLAISGIVMLADLVTLPVRLIDFDRKVYTKKDHDEDRSRLAEWSPRRAMAGDCGGIPLVFRAGRARLPIEKLLAPPGRWQGTIVCRVRDGAAELLTHPIHLDRLARRSPRVRQYIAARQALILKDLAAALRNGDGSGVNRSASRDIESLEKIIDLTRYIRPAGRPPLYRVKEIGEDLFYVRPERITPLLVQMDASLRQTGY